MKSCGSHSPLLIAHRGASGERPEHTLASYHLAIAQGCDFIEPDLVFTRDGVLVARHENEISATSDVADHPEFASRRTVKYIEGVRWCGWFTEDFTLVELKSLRARERLPHLRGTAYDGCYDIPTFVEILELVAQANRTRPPNMRPVGIYPETKHPQYFTSIGLPHEAPLLALLDRYGYRGRNAAVYIQSFAVGNLQSLRAKSDLPLIQLIAATGHPADRPDSSYATMITSAGLRDIACYADGIGPDKELIIPRTAEGRLADATNDATNLVATAHAAGLAVHPWAFRRENFFLPLALQSRSAVQRGSDSPSGNDSSAIDPAGHGALAQEIATYLAIGIDGFFTDNPAEALVALARHRDSSLA